MKEIHNQLQNEQSKYAQRYVRDFDSMMIKYYIGQFKIDNHGIKEQATKEAKKARELLLTGISSHLEQYMSNIKSLGGVSSQENNIKKISEYMIKAKTFMHNIIQMKNKIFNIVLPMTTLTFVDSKTKKEIQKLHLDNPIARIGLLPFETIINEVALLCENGIKSIDSWLNYLKNKRVQYLETVVNQSKVQAAQEQTKAAKWTFRTQLGFMILSVLFIIVSFFLSEYKEDWINFFNNEQNIKKTSVEKDAKTKKLPVEKDMIKTEKILILDDKKELKKIQLLNEDKSKNEKNYRR